MRQALRMMSVKQSNNFLRQRIALNIKRLRSEKSLSQEKLAELADFHRTYISQLERCVTNISVDGLERIAQALNVDILELFRPV